MRASIARTGRAAEAKLEASSSTIVKLEFDATSPLPEARAASLGARFHWACGGGLAYSVLARTQRETRPGVEQPEIFTNVVQGIVCVTPPVCAIIRIVTCKTHDRTRIRTHKFFPYRANAAGVSFRRNHNHVVRIVAAAGFRGFRAPLPAYSR